MLAVVWGVGGMLLALTILFAGANLVVIVMLSLALLGGTMGIVDSGSKNNTQRNDEAEGSREKTKRGEGAAINSDSDALLRLLSEEDREELRHRVKQRLLDTIEQGSDGELSSLDALLAEQQTRSNR
jgi:flagellar basal body-associated protein FliL